MTFKTNILIASAIIASAFIGAFFFDAQNEAITQIEPSTSSIDIEINTVKDSAQQERPHQTITLPAAQSKNKTSSCLNVESMLTQSKKKDEKKEDIVQVLKQLNVTNASRKVIDSLLVISGIGEYEGHLLLRNDDLNKVIHLTQRNIDFFNSRQTENVKELFKNNDIDNGINSLIALYSNKTLSSEKRFLINGKAYTPLEIVLTFFIKNKDDYTRIKEIINTLVDAGVPIQFSDIVEYTAKGAPTEILHTLSDNFLGDINQAFFYEDQIHTLVTLSVKKSVIDSIIFWLAENINPSPLKYRANAMDYIATYKKGAQLEETVSLLLDYDVRPNKSSTFHFLSKNLSNEYQQKNKKQLDLFNYKNLTLEETKVRNAAIQNIFNIATRDLIMKSDCSISIESIQNLVRQIYSYTDSSKNENTPIEQTLPEVFDKFEELEHTKNNVPNLEDSPVIKKGSVKSKDPKKLERQIKLMEDGHWKEFLDERLEGVEITPKEKLDTSFTLALLAGANSKDLIELIEKGAEVNPNLASFIVQKCKLDVLQSLYINEYNFHYVYSDGSNAISDAVLHKKLENLNFLITIGLSVNEEENPLDIAVMALQFDPSIYINIINSLVEAGATVTDLHRKYVNQLASSDSDLYLTLISKHPTLKM